MEGTCKRCKRFRLHYIKGRHRHGAYEPLYYGHCVYPRRKRRDADTPACEHFCARAICKIRRRQA